MKKRLDILVTERGLAESREKAKALIMAGQIYVDNQKADKPGDTFPEECRIESRGKGLPYVSRGGLKLEKAMEEFPITLEGKTCMDIAPQPAVLPTACSKRARGKSTPWTWATASWPGTCATTPGWSTWSAPTPGTLTREQIPRGGAVLLGGRLLYLPDLDSAPRPGAAGPRRPGRLPD